MTIMQMNMLQHLRLHIILLLLIELTRGLEAVLVVTPDTVNAVSTLQMTIMFDETVGGGAKISVAVPDTDILDQDQNALIKPLSFNDQDEEDDDNTVSCQSDSISAAVSHCTATSRQLELYMSADSFIMAGDSLTFTIENACTNPSSLWFEDQSLEIISYNQEGL